MKSTNLLTEEILTMATAAQEAPNRPDVSTLWRWSTRGIKGHKLETLKIGGRTFTTRQALTRFFEAINA